MRQRVVYVIEFKSNTARGWKEVSCESNKKDAVRELKKWKYISPDDKWRVTPYYPQED